MQKARRSRRAPVEDGLGELRERGFVRTAFAEVLRRIAETYLFPCKMIKKYFGRFAETTNRRKNCAGKSQSPGS